MPVMAVQQALQPMPAMRVRKHLLLMPKPVVAQEVGVAWAQPPLLLVTLAPGVMRVPQPVLVAEAMPQ